MIVLIAAAVLSVYNPGWYGEVLEHDEVVELASAYDDWNPYLMAEIWWCESWYHTMAMGPDKHGNVADVGLTQVNRVHWADYHPVFLMAFPWYSVYAAHEIWLMQGYHAWSCYEGDS